MPPNDLIDDRFTWTWFILFGQLGFTVFQSQLATFIGGIVEELTVELQLDEIRG